MGVRVWLSRNAPARPADEVQGTPATCTGAAAAGLDWSDLETAVAQCRACDLHRGRTQTVFGVGNQDARWMIIGEAPGAEEDRRGEPFVGRAGQLLNAMLLAAGYKRHEVYIANIVKCRPPNNRDPRPEEATACSSFLARQIELVRPRLILAVGRVAAQRLLQTDTPVGKMRGRLYHYGDEPGVPVVVTYHPAYLLRSPGAKEKVWQDLLFALEQGDG
ncbi:MAG: uracil-DNA glycosylase [Gammaproteobacteria bacterium]|nr:uracil-DNA glycosylase [Gammaproteobacteria bacterium]NNF60269.1 uracil-DNA glycosylase [Gammaproteobacteria bacterium]NNM20377.1 uracil-DNA glycosylase [Gammaproteobacteria bacterium]